MTRRRSRARAMNPLLMWTDLAFKTAEMMTASAQVIGHRSRRIAAAGAVPNARDRREFALMGQEKIDATVESVRAMTQQVLTIDPLLAVRVGQHMLAAAAAMMSLASGRTAAQLLARQGRLLRVAADSTAALTKISTTSARIAHSGMQPIHSRARANASRLSRR
jgi:hypothetical protein